jgi:hypothetical protein
MALVCKVQGGFDTSDTTGMGHVAQYTDDVSLAEQLPGIPSNLPHTPDSTSSTQRLTAPTDTTDNAQGASLGVEHKSAVIAESTTSKELKRSHQEMEYVETYPG